MLSQCSLAFSGNGSKLENRYMNKLREKIKPKQDKLIESEILTPDDVEYMQKKGFIEVDDNDNISLTAKGIQLLQQKRMRERPQEFKASGEPKDYVAKEDYAESD